MFRVRWLLREKNNERITGWPIYMVYMAPSTGRGHVVTRISVTCCPLRVVWSCQDNVDRFRFGGTRKADKRGNIMSYDVIEKQTWIGATALTPEEMGTAMGQTLNELGLDFERVGQDIEYPPKKEVHVFKVKQPQIIIDFYWNVPVCSTYPLCPTLEECLWAYKPLGIVRIAPVCAETESVLQRILTAWVEKLPREIWRFNKEYLEYYVNEKGMSRAQLMELNFLRKWARWGITEFPSGVQDLPEGCLSLSL